jgi:hypothetical protein
MTVLPCILASPSLQSFHAAFLSISSFKYNGTIRMVEPLSFIAVSYAVRFSSSALASTSFASSSRRNRFRRIRLDVLL